jgi:hypothetical protein
MIRESVPTESKLFRLDFIKLKQLLANAPQDSQNSQSNLIIEFPNPEGELIQYRIYEAPVMEKELSDKYPDIKSYSGSNVNNPSETIRFSVTLFGLHLMCFNNESGTYLIDTYTKDLQNYCVYYKKNITDTTIFRCGVEDVENSHKINEKALNETLRASDQNFRTYRIAIACTIEYSAYHVNAAGLNAGTLAQKKAAVLAAMVVTMTRVNGVFEKDMSLRMNLIANE